MASRADAKVHKVELLQLADEKYPIRAERLEDVLEEAAGKRVNRIGLLTPRQVVPDGVIYQLEKIVGKENVVDLQETYQRIRYEKSDIEMALTRDASIIADAMMRCMLAVLRPGQLETQVAGWAYWAAKELGSEENGWDVMVTSGEANRTLIGKALNQPILEGDFVHLGVAPKRDGLNACVRRSLVAVENPSQVTSSQKYWFDFIEQAYQVGDEAYRRVAKEGLPAFIQEKALVDFFASFSGEVSVAMGNRSSWRRSNLTLELIMQVTPSARSSLAPSPWIQPEPLGNQIITMLDVAVRGIGDHWDDIILPDLDYIVIENTLGKFGNQVENFNHLPLNVQSLVGKG